MRELKIDLSDLDLAFESGGEMLTFYLDTETGEIINITDDDRRSLENIYESYYDEQTQLVDWTVVFQNEDIPDWQQKSLRDADRIEDGLGSRFIEIPPQDSHEGYRDMQAFIGTLLNLRLQEQLERAIAGRGAFRYFKDVLLDYPDERAQWFQFEQNRRRQRMADWLEEKGISPLS
jgi:hypothetical protein